MQRCINNAAAANRLSQCTLLTPDIHRQLCQNQVLTHTHSAGTVYSAPAACMLCCRQGSSTGLQLQGHPPFTLWWLIWPSFRPCTRPPCRPSSPCLVTALMPVRGRQMWAFACACSPPLPCTSCLTRCSAACLSSTSCSSPSCWPLLLPELQAKSLRYANTIYLECVCVCVCVCVRARLPHLLRHFETHIC